MAGVIAAMAAREVRNKRERMDAPPSDFPVFDV